MDAASLLPAAVGTVVLTIATTNAMQTSSKVRYGVLDDKGNKILVHPYSPWQAVPTAQAAAAAKAYRACRAYENTKEWAQLSLPVMWLFQIYGSSIPYVEQHHIDVATVGLSGLWFVAAQKYVAGYIKDADDRSGGFKRRTQVFKVWAFGSIAAIACAALARYAPGVLPK